MVKAMEGWRMPGKGYEAHGGGEGHGKGGEGQRRV